ncbi:redoxin domain-containing protein [Flavobacterium suzhouense]|uniref:Redoxin domain-containing protein n=1 Tax=Flavobacterium suzhouense TaxID=1529638 RepID=A0ABW5P058_9FLAO
MNRVKIGVGLMLFLGVMLTSCNKKTETEAEKTSEPVTEIQKNNPPTPLKVYTKDGVSVKAYDFDKLEYFLTQKNDTTYVVNFWATWCVPCVEELPHFEKLNEKYKQDKVKVMLVSLDMYKMVESRLLPFIKEKQLKSDVVYLRDPDQNTWLPKVDSTWSGALPATLIYNKDRRKFYEQQFTYEELEKEVSNFK